MPDATYSEETRAQLNRESGSVERLVRGFQEASSKGKRKLRQYAATYRGEHKYSGQEAAQMVAVLLALEMGEISEGIAAGALGVDRVSLREAKLKIAEVGIVLACEWRAANPPNTQDQTRI